MEKDDKKLYMHEHSCCMSMLFISYHYKLTRGWYSWVNIAIIELIYRYVKIAF